MNFILCGRGVDGSISFRAWDFAGQDLYHTTHQFFLSKRSIYLLVFNLLHMLQNKSDATATVRAPPLLFSSLPVL